MKVLINVTYYDFESYQENMYIIFDSKIVEIGKMENYHKLDYTEIDCFGKLVMPGLVNGHSHIYSTFARGMSTYFNPSNFKELLEQLWWKMDRNLNNDMNYYSSLVSAVEYAKNGVTTVIDHHASGEITNSLNHIKKGIDEVGLRGVYCFESSDRFEIDECIKENITFIKENRTSKATGLFGMHASFTLSDDSLSKIKEQINAPIHIHVAESILDQDLSLQEHGKRVIERLNDFDLISENSILTHCLYLSDNELDIIKEKEAVIALNVTSNMNNSVGLPDYIRMKNKGIKVIIGNDGISQNIVSEYKMLYYAMHYLSQSPTLFSFDDIINIINNTYEYASDILNCKLGKIKEGFEADLLVLPYTAPTPLNEDNIFGHLFFGLFNDFYPEDVFVSGVKIVSKSDINDELMTKYNHAPKYAEMLWNKMKKEG